MDTFSVFSIVVLAVFLLLMAALLVNAVLNSRPIHPNKPHGFEAIDRAIEKYDEASACNNWQSSYRWLRR